jgi:hypothetical protein
MTNLALNRPLRSRFASPLQLSFEPILLAAHLLAQPNYGDSSVTKGASLQYFQYYSIYWFTTGITASLLKGPCLHNTVFTSS